MSSVGAFLIAVSVLVFLFNFFLSLRRGEESGPDPWDARTLEWSIPSPPPEYNFKEIPTVTSLDQFWNEKYREDETGQVVPVLASGAAEDEAPAEDAEGEHGHGIHMPSPSYMPLIAASGFPIVATGLIYDYALVPVGFALILIGFYGWVLEPATEEE
jgi:cytochrome c oxidase subunit 1